MTSTPPLTDIRPRVLSLAVDDQDHTRALELAFLVAGYFGIDKKTVADLRQATNPDETWLIQTPAGFPASIFALNLGKFK